MKKILTVFVCTLLCKAVFANSSFNHPTQIIVAHKGMALEKNDLVVGIKNLNNPKNKMEEEIVSLIDLAAGVDANVILKQFEKNDQIIWAAPNIVYEGEYREFTPNDPMFKKQDHHAIMETLKAWNFSKGKKDIIVAITDDGFDLTHPDLKNGYHQNKREVAGNGIDDDKNGYIDDKLGWNFNENNNNPGHTSRGGAHGTHVAGIVGAEINNGEGIAGFSPRLKMMPLKFYGQRRWTSAMVYAAYAYAADNKAKILTTSYNIDGFVKDRVFRKAVDYAFKKGLILFNSAGNNSREQPKRVALKKIILVASSISHKRSRDRDKKSRFSNYGYGIDITAPGDPILSTGRNGLYFSQSGTSMAAPAAAAVAGYIWSVHPNWTREKVIHQLLTTAEPIDKVNTKYAHKLGSGRVNLYKAIENDYSPSSVTRVNLDKAKGEVQIQLRGLINKRLSNYFVSIKNGMNVHYLKLKEKYEVGTNVLRFSLPSGLTGPYQLTINGRLAKNPFAQELDADNDGVEGGVFQKIYDL